MATATLNPKAGNGHVLIYGSNGGFSTGYPSGDAALWAALRGGTGTRSVSADGSGIKRLTYVDGGTAFADANHYIGRLFLPFDRSEFTGDATAAVLRLYISSTNKSAAVGGSLYLVASTQASLSSLSTGDFTAVGSTPLSDDHPTVSSIGSNAYVEWTLNAAGITHLASGGKFAIRHSSDLNNVVPPVEASPPAKYDDLFGYYLGNGSNMPELAVTYTPAPAGGIAPRRDRALLPFYSFPD